MRVALYSYWRSSSAWRVRIGLHLKGVPFEYRPVDLREGAQFGEAHRARNPLGQVPVLEVQEDGGPTRHLAQSMAILEFLEERFPSPPLLPADPYGRARVRMIAEVVNSGIQPFQNQAPQKWLHAKQPGLEKAWVEHWLSSGMAALERAVAAGAGRHAHGDSVTLADAYIVPQLYGARRFGIDLGGCPTLLAVEAACRELPAFQAADPERQPDAPSSEGPHPGRR
ncbi:MAG TPA: maleylacetoacetate isomerase [Anaeromyxobacteraceae bacterium]|nr:maleylacetoacetate isomerase [Anaeromyxobacteraceae bacterium]